MSWRTVVVTGIAKLDYRLEYLVVRKADEETRIHLSEIGLLMIESTAVSLTVALIAELVKHKIKVVFCDEKHNPSSELMPYYGSHDTSAKIRTQIAWDPEIKTSVGTDIIAEKIRQQSIHLLDRGYKSEAELLQEYVECIEFGDATNREGHAAKVYFNALFGKDFSRSQDNNINAALNYGYGILLSYFTREIVANGYVTQLGIIHDNMFNQFNLASDLMEPFRIIVDRKICDIDLDKFDYSEKLKILGVFNGEVRIEGRLQYISAAIRIYCKSVFDALNEKDLSLMKFYQYEL